MGPNKTSEKGTRCSLPRGHHPLPPRPGGLLEVLGAVLRGPAGPPRGSIDPARFWGVFFSFLLSSETNPVTFQIKADRVARPALRKTRLFFRKGVLGKPMLQGILASMLHVCFECDCVFVQSIDGTHSLRWDRNCVGYGGWEHRKPLLVSQSVPITDPKRRTLCKFRNTK